jgi:RNA polymerase-associated protein RTF1
LTCMLTNCKGFVEDKPYAIEAANGKQVRTTQYIRAAHGKSERNWPFFSASDSPFTEVCRKVSATLIP